jgi:hypothetical protein
LNGQFGEFGLKNRLFLSRTDRLVVSRALPLLLVRSLGNLIELRVNGARWQGDIGRSIIA